MSIKRYFVYSAILIATYALLTWVQFLLSLPTHYHVEGKVDECCCETQMLKDVNKRIVSLTDNITNEYFFKIFKVNLEGDCPFWAQELLCKNPGQCTVCECNDREVPHSWIFKKDSLVTTEKDISTWESEPKKKITWHVEDIENEKGTFVDLKKNPEKFTGYQGQRIWNTIYSENCFSGSLEEMCVEERLLFRIISGLHTSISTQLTEFYGENNKTRPNWPLFFQKVGDHPDRIENLYFAYSVMLRAINRAQKLIQNYNYDTGDLQSDLKTKQYIDRLYDITTKNCDHPFDESEIFSDITKVEVKDKFITYFHNISRILDCVECEVCKVYSKLQTYGISAALKILFSEKLGGESEVTLKRNELIALINTFNKFSTSLEFIDRMFARRRAYYIGFSTDCVVALLFFIGSTWLLYKAYQDKVQRVTGSIRQECNYENKLKKL